ncbi:hypothetical protein U1Q18_004108 [Sarracenia purpurea var. burkii]
MHKNQRERGGQESGENSHLSMRRNNRSYETGEDSGESSRRENEFGAQEIPKLAGLAPSIANSVAEPKEPTDFEIAENTDVGGFWTAGLGLWAWFRFWSMLRFHIAWIVRVVGLLIDMLLFLCLAPGCCWKSRKVAGGCACWVPFSLVLFSCCLACVSADLVWCLMPLSALLVVFLLLGFCWVAAFLLRPPVMFSLEFILAFALLVVVLRSLKLPQRAA